MQPSALTGGGVPLQQVCYVSLCTLSGRATVILCFMPMVVLSVSDDVAVVEPGPVVA